MIGDHIRARRGGRWTHAIDCGDETVLFLREEPGVSPADRVARSYRPEFLAGADVVEVVTHRERVFAPRQVVARAFSRTSDPALAAMFGDSQAFAEWCKAGRVPAGAYNHALSVPGVPAARPVRAPAAARPAAAPARARPARKARPAARAKPAAPARKAAAKPGKKKVAARPAARKAAKTRPAAARKGEAARPAARRAAPAKARRTAKARRG